MHPNEVFHRTGCEASEIQEDLVSKTVMSKKTILRQGCELPLNALKLLASVVVTEFHTVEAYSSLGRTSVKYNTSRLSRVEKEQVTVRVKPSVLTDWEKM
jgi:hypothetical protein